MSQRCRIRGLHPLRLAFPGHSPISASMPVSPAPPYNPGQHRCQPVWALPSSLAATGGISFDFSSCRYLDGSLPSSPQLFAAIRVLRRLAAPRHPPWTLFHLTILSFRFLRYLFLKIVLEAQGLEPWTLGLQSRCSSQLSHAPGFMSNWKERDFLAYRRFPLGRSFPCRSNAPFSQPPAVSPMAYPFFLERR